MRINISNSLLRVFWKYDREAEETTTCYVVDGTTRGSITDKNGKFEYLVKATIKRNKKDRYIKAVARKYSLAKAIQALYPSDAQLRTEFWDQAFDSNVNFAPKQDRRIKIFPGTLPAAVKIAEEEELSFENDWR